jgi:hypothetical protein
MRERNILNPLGADFDYLIVDSESALPLFDAQTPQERFQEEREAIELTEDGYLAAIKVARAESHILGLQRRLASLACHRAAKERLPNDPS